MTPDPSATKPERKASKPGPALTMLIEPMFPLVARKRLPALADGPMIDVIENLAALATNWTSDPEGVADRSGWLIVGCCESLEVMEMLMLPTLAPV